MVTGLRKNIQGRFLLYPLYGLIFLWLVLSVGHELFHNHEPDLLSHQDCPAFQLYLLLNSTILVLWIFHFIFTICALFFINEYNVTYRFSNKTYFPRAPPLRNS